MNKCPIESWSECRFLPPPLPAPSIHICLSVAISFENILYCSFGFCAIDLLVRYFSRERGFEMRSLSRLHCNKNWSKLICPADLVNESLVAVLPIDVHKQSMYQTHCIRYYQDAPRSCWPKKITQQRSLYSERQSFLLPEIRFLWPNWLCPSNNDSIINPELRNEIRLCTRT